MRSPRVVQYNLCADVCATSAPGRHKSHNQPPQCCCCCRSPFVCVQTENYALESEQQRQRSFSTTTTSMLMMRCVLRDAALRIVWRCGRQFGLGHANVRLSRTPTRLRHRLRACAHARRGVRPFAYVRSFVGRRPIDRHGVCDFHSTQEALEWHGRRGQTAGSRALTRVSCDRIIHLCEQRHNKSGYRDNFKC